MARANLNDLQAFALVAQERSFTKAAAKMGVTQSTLSHTVGALEARLGVRLLTRTTRSVSPTEAGERLLRTLAPRLDEIESALSALGDLREKPAGTIRITATDYAVKTILWPKLSKLMPAYPELKIELVVDYALTDIVAQRFDLGVRSGDQVAKDMIAVRIAPDRRMAIVGAPAYLATRAMHKTPQDLIHHNCINLRLPTHGGLYAWELQKGKRALQVRVEGQCTFNNTYQMLEAALDGCGLAYIPEDVAQPYFGKNRLVPVLEHWWPALPGHHVYYPSRRHTSKALSVIVEALRYRQ